MIDYLKKTLDLWDYVFFGSAFILVVAFLMFLLFVLGLPGKIAVSRNHPDAEAVNLMGWVGFMAIIPWINALIWAFKPTDIVDIRRYPKEEADATAAMIAKMKADAGPRTKNKPAVTGTAPSGLEAEPPFEVRKDDQA